MLFLFAGILVLIGFFGKTEGLLWNLLSVAVSLSGLVFIYIYVAFSRTSFKLFMGTMLSANGMFLLANVRRIFPLGFEKLWPVMILIVSAALFAASRTRRNRFNFAYDYTAVFLFAIGIFFLLFSLGIIKHTFSQVMVYLLPMLFIFAGVFLILLFLHRKALLKMIPPEIYSKFEEEIYEEEGGEDF